MLTETQELNREDAKAQSKAEVVIASGGEAVSSSSLASHGSDRQSARGHALRLGGSLSKRPPAAPLMPPRAPRNILGLTVRLCLECFNPFAQKRCDQKFCDTPCRHAWNARIEARKTEAYHAGMAMRSKAKGAFSRLTNLFDRWIAEDRKREERYRAACAEKGVEA